MTTTPDENPAPFEDPTLDRSDEVPDADLPDAVHVMIGEMRQGYARYGEIADEARRAAARDRQTALRHDDEVTEYRAKQKAMGALMVRLGYDPLDPAVTPETPDGAVAAPDYVDDEHR